jgi:hypothetical protein
MSNPRIVNTAEVKQFGFTAVIDLEARKLLLDASVLTLFQTGGQALSLGINFEVIDPAGVVIQAINFPQKFLDPAAGQLTGEIPLPSGIALFGKYDIRAQLKEGGGVVHEVVLPSKEVCEPKGFKDGLALGSFDVQTDCEAPFIRLTETTFLSYLGKAAVKIVRSGRLYHPAGTGEELAFAKTPFQTNRVYTGDSTVRNKTVADYDLGDNFYVRVAYATTKKISVTCQSRMARLLCCVSNLYARVEKECGTPAGTAARLKLDKAAMPMLIAVMKERSGQPATAEIEAAERILDCDCDCTDSEGDGTPVLIAGSAGDQKAQILALLNLAKNDAEIRAVFCSINCQTVSSCAEVTSITAAVSLT